MEDTEVIITDPEPYPVAYLRVARGRLVEKEGWVRPGVEELRAMLGLGGDEGVEGIDQAGRELLDDLKRSSPSASSEIAQEPDMSGLAISGDVDEGVRFNKREKWFAASITGITRGKESIGEELKRCFDSIQGKASDCRLNVHELTTKLP